MNAMVPGLAGGKMSASDPNSKIDFLDTAEVVRKKISKAFCEEGNTTENGILAFLQAVLIPISQMRLERLHGRTGVDKEEGQDAIGKQEPFVSADAPEGTVFTVELDAKDGGGFRHYKSFEEVEKDFAEKKLYPKVLKGAVASAINKLLDPIRKSFEENEEWQETLKLAYPDPNAKPEKKKASIYHVILRHVLFTLCMQEKKYHPPPPGKGKDAKQVAAVATEATADSSPPVVAAPPPGADIIHAVVETAKQQTT